MARAWTIGALRLSTQDGPVLVPGWTNGVMGIDWRAGSQISEYECAFVITHLATGWSICALCDNLPQVQRAAEIIASALDWSVASVEELRAVLSAGAGELRDLLGVYGGHHPTPYRMAAGAPTSPSSSACWERSSRASTPGWASP